MSFGMYKDESLAPIIQHFGEYTFRLYRPVVGDQSGLVVPEGFITDLASVPRTLWTIYPPHGKYLRAAIIHDYMYHTAFKSKKHADVCFYRNMRKYGVGRIDAKIMYRAVRSFGKGNYGKPRVQSIAQHTFDMQRQAAIN